MKTPPCFRPRQTRAVALVIVLAMLVLLSGLLVAFMTAVTNEHNSTTANANTVTARQIADNTTNLVIAQIREATTRYTESATWASQPGAIRVFSGRESGGKVTIAPENGYQYEYTPGTDDWVYKLYSSEKLRVKGTDYLPGGTGMKPEIDAINGWATKKDGDFPEYVDLNEPLVTARADLNSGGKTYGEPHYPIVDPRARFGINEKVLTGSSAGIVEGFAAKTTNYTSGTSKLQTPSGQPIPALPMPVQWLYVLRDGTILGPDAVAALGKDLAKNPIIGRTGFWADDESCKVNLNTASEGTYWDTPSVSTEQESGNVTAGGPSSSTPTSLALAACQPSRGEYQRYPGHPATTCLSPVLGWIWGLAPGPTNQGDPKLVDFKNAIAQISPFLPSGTTTPAGTKNLGKGVSLGGTDNTDKDRPDKLGVIEDPAARRPLLPILTKHLYATTDDFVFSPARNTGGTTPKGITNDPTNPKPQQSLTQALEKVRFFLTANSRAPELNLFNRPRVTFWPVSQPGPQDPANTSRRTSYDNLFAFTSTIGNKAFYFNRFYARDPVTDINSKANTDMLGYLQWLTGDNGRDIPGFGGSFKKKYAYSKNGVTERDQILTLIYDYMRSTNLVDTGTAKVSVNTRFISYTPFYGAGQAGYGAVVDRPYDWSGQVTPALTSSGNPLGTGLQGLGRFATISEAALLFTRAGDVTANVQKNMQVVLLLEMATPMPGYPGLRQTIFTRVKGGSGQFGVPKIKIKDQEYPVFPAGSQWDNIVNVSSHEVGEGRVFMPTMAFTNQLYYFPEHKDFTYPELYPNDSNFNTKATITRKTFMRDGSTAPGAYVRNKSVTFYPYVSDLMAIYDAAGKAATTFDLEDGAFEVEIWTGEAPGDPRAFKVQTITLHFPAVTLNVPAGAGATKQDFGLRPPSPVTNKDDTGWGPFRATDMARAIEYVGTDSKGQSLPNQQAADLRLAMIRPVLTANDYAPRDPVEYAKAATQLVHGMHWGHGDPMPGFNEDTKKSFMAANGTKRDGKPFILPVGVNGVLRSDGGPGDYDRGLSKHMDGAFGNKVDEGNVFYNYADNDLGGKCPYYRGRGIEEVGQSFFSPNRQLPSAVMFGSLPSGGLEGKPWQTLLFRPDRPAGGANHPGASLPEDHLLLDLFHLPTIEPYAISEPFSTAGKINLNYVMAPYGYATGDGAFGKDKVPNPYIRRDTGLRAVLKSVKFLGVETGAAVAGHNETPVDVKSKWRYDIDLDNTISKIEQRFQDPKRGLFRSASEICTVDLYPVAAQLPKALTTWGNFWETLYAQTGDNQRERPYAHIYPRVTTKSNVFTVHMRCQAIRQGKRDVNDSYAFDPKKDQVVSEYRGSAIVERFVDPNDPDLIKDPLTGTAYDYKASSVDPYYRFRIVSTKQFSPK